MNVSRAEQIEKMNNKVMTLNKLVWWLCEMYSFVCMCGASVKMALVIDFVVLKSFHSGFCCMFFFVYVHLPDSVQNLLYFIRSHLAHT